MVFSSLSTTHVRRPSIAERLKNVPSLGFEMIDALGRCWFLLLATLGVGFLLVFVPQGREALWASGTTGQHEHVLMFFVTSISGAVLVTFFAAQILEPALRHEGDVAPVRRYACFTVPALVGLFAAFLVPLLIEHMAAGNPYLLPQRRQELQRLGFLFQVLALPAIVLARCPQVLLSLAFAWRLERQRVVEAISLVVILVLGLLLSLFPFMVGTFLLFAGLVVLDAMWWQTGLEPAMCRWRRWAGFALALLWLAAGLWVAAQPETRGPAIGPAALALFAEFFWIAVAYLVFLVLGRWLSQGVSIALLIVVAALFLTGPFNLRSVRTISPLSSAAAAARRHALSEHIDHWLESRRQQIQAAPDRYPVFIVSAEGGGIRAACWTAGVLCALQDAEPGFADHVLGISGVSGGSLGAATFVALVREAHLGNLAHPRSNATGPMQAYAAEVLGSDFLSPVLATMLIPDVAGCLLHIEQFDDRASALEKAFEISWRKAVGTNAFAEPLEALWVSSAPDRVPALFLNSTEPDTGQRIVNSHVVIDPGLSSAISLPNHLDTTSLRLSTAVLLSARFPAISPIGSLDGDKSVDPVHIVDGGYVDNSGTLTAREVAAALVDSASRLGLRQQIRLVAVVITDDPIVEKALRPGKYQQRRFGLEGSAAGALLSPLETLDRVRQALSRRHREAFDAQIRAADGEVLDGFALGASKVEFPLGWMLANSTRAALTLQIQALQADPRSDFLRVRTLLSQGASGGH